MTDKSKGFTGNRDRIEKSIQVPVEKRETDYTANQSVNKKSEKDK